MGYLQTGATPTTTATGKWNVTANLKSGGTITLATQKDEAGARSMFAYAKGTGNYSVIALYNGTTLVERYPTASAGGGGTDWMNLVGNSMNVASSIFGKQQTPQVGVQQGPNYMPYLLIGGAALAAFLLLRKK